MVGKIEEINLRAVSIFTTAQLTAVPPYYSVDTSVDSVDSTMTVTAVTAKRITIMYLFVVHANFLNLTFS